MHIFVVHTYVAQCADSLLILTTRSAHLSKSVRPVVRTVHLWLFQSRRKVRDLCLAMNTGSSRIRRRRVGEAEKGNMQ